MIKARKDHGMKAHVFEPGSEKVWFTFRFSYISPEKLLFKVRGKILHKKPELSAETSFVIVKAKDIFYQ